MVIKSNGGDGCAFNVACSLLVEGALSAVGTASEPITFTSIEDNSVGGHTGTGTPVAGQWDGVASIGSGSIDLEHAEVSYARVGVLAYGEGDSTVRDVAFADLSGSSAVLAGDPDPVLEGNSSNGATGSSPAYVVSGSALDLDQLGANDATGGVPVVQLAGTLGKSSTLRPEGAAWELGTTQVPTATNWTHLRVPAGETMTIAPGAVIKGANGDGCAFNVACSLLVEGALSAVGTASEPITFTSIEDNSVGGHTGTGTPVAGQWDGVASIGSGSIDLEHAEVSYARTALALYGEAASLVRGDLSHNASAIRACDWNSNCSVDAAYVNWESEGGPASPGYVCGAVTTSPYLFDGSSHEDGSISENCDGTSNPWEELEEGQETFNQRIASAQNLCAELGEDVCQAVNTAFNCLSGAFELGASQLAFALPNPFAGGSSGSEWESGAKTVAAAGAEWLSSSEDQDVADFGKIVSRGLEIVGVASTFKSLADAYGKCAP